jgi:hypothetical protein
MFEVRKLAKNKLWFIDIIKSAPGKVKSQYPDLDDSKYDFVYFSHVFILLTEILDYISAEAEIAKTTPEEKYKLFEEFNDGKNAQYIIKEEYDKFMERVEAMLTAATNN